ncbi:mucin-1-like [Musca domestica]|uniref:Mucin-1-like n=1 Tax=Musca domestica TaxID=7370 RepID=A0A9J7DB29_MUSDO|nr:mucin-1-like [Musca domestica]
MANLSQMAASLPYYDEDIPITDEEGGVEDAIIPLGSQDSDIRGVSNAAAPLREPATALPANSPGSTAYQTGSASPLRENCTAEPAPNPGSSSQTAGDTPQVLLASSSGLSTASADTAAPLWEIAPARSASPQDSAWTVGTASPLRELAPVVHELQSTDVATTGGMVAPLRETKTSTSAETPQGKGTVDVPPSGMSGIS